VEIERSPLLGEHTEEILREVLGYSDAETLTLKEAGAFSKEQPKIKEYHPLREAG
jgi:formyl-CoA transferase